MTVVRLLLEKGGDFNICDNVAVDFISCTCILTFSQFAVCYILCMYVVYGEQSAGSLHKHSCEMEIEAKCKSLQFLTPTCTGLLHTTVVQYNINVWIQCDYASNVV